MSAMWFGFRESVAGDGTIEYFSGGQAVRLSSYTASSGNRANLYWEALAVPGVTYMAKFSARVTAGFSGSEEPTFVIDYPISTNPVKELRLSEQWQEYAVSYTVPFDAKPEDGERVQLAFGVFSDRTGEVEFTRPLVSALNEPFVASQMMRWGEKTDDGFWLAYPTGELIQYLVAQESRSSSGQLATHVTFPREFADVGIPPDNTKPFAAQVTSYTTTENVERVSVGNEAIDGCDVFITRSTSISTVFAVHAIGRWKE